MSMTSEDLKELEDVFSDMERGEVIRFMAGIVLCTLTFYGMVFYFGGVF